MALLFRGESRWKIFTHHLFWIKIAEIVSLNLICGLRSQTLYLES
jgi:hypothetical protein